jgi:Kef-type K+ transport system membrane component KefB
MTRRTVFGYAAMLAAAVGVFLLIVHAGQALRAPSNADVPTLHNATTQPPGTLTHVLVSMVVIIVFARTLGALFRKMHQPNVIGEMIAGIILGPSLLGHFAPLVSAFVLPNNVAPFLSVISQIGVILYMFLVGVELNTGLLGERTHSSVAISHASIITPFLLGGCLAWWLYPVYSTDNNISFLVFALFIGVAMSVTAFPVLARILTDRGMQSSKMGAIALACAAVDDVTAWCLFALVVSIAKAQPGHVFVTLGLTATYIAGVLLLVRPATAWFIRTRTSGPKTSQDSIVVVCAALLLGALATQRIGIHALFGAFLMGAVIPHDSVLARDIKAKFEDLVVVLFLPVFFAFTGMRTEIGLVHGAAEWLTCIFIILVASAGKFGGGAIAARITGLGWHEAASLGALMNTRGLMELIVLNVGLDLGVLSPTLFTMLVIMAVVTTMLTTPLLHLCRQRRPSEDPAWQTTEQSYL